MMKFLGNAGTSYVKSKAEERFQQAAIVLTQMVTVEQWQAIATNGTEIGPLLEHIKTEPVDETDTMVQIGIAHLNSLSVDEYIDLIGEVAPDHGTFLKANPVFAEALCSEIKELANQRV
tara:strand:+ start:380 stop:736 length:357 start_codon:yes stop_codon:yes gene_type:complete